MYILYYRAQSFNTGPKFPTTPCLDVDFNEFCMNIDQDHRESRGSVSYTDYYSNEDGQIRKCGFGAGFGSNLQKIIHTDDLPIDNIDDDEDHTITLKQTEEQKKQDVKQIFEQKESPSIKSNSCKKIGRFVVPQKCDAEIKSTHKIKGFFFIIIFFLDFLWKVWIYRTKTSELKK